MSCLQEIFCLEKKNGREAGMRLCIAVRSVKKITQIIQTSLANHSSINNSRVERGRVPLFKISL